MHEQSYDPDMNLIRTLAYILCAIILVKSFHCTVAEAGCRTAVSSPSLPDEGCDSGCLCKGVVFAKPVNWNPDQMPSCPGMIPWQDSILSDSLRLGLGDVLSYRVSIQATRASGRSLRALISSLTQ